MVYKIEVFNDGDIIVTKLLHKQPFESNLCLYSLGKVKAELQTYGVQELEDDMNEIVNCKLHESVQCV